MAKETHFERETIIKHMVEELGYAEFSSNQFNNEYMMLPSEVMSFFKTHYKEALHSIMKSHYGNVEKICEMALCEALSKHLYQMHNVAIYLNKSFKWHDKSFDLYLPFTEKGKDKNSYVIISQCTMSTEGSNGKVSVKPDISVFVNGFLIGITELKHIGTGQNAQSNGRSKIFGDYAKFIREGVIPFESDDMTDKERQVQGTKALRCFHAPIQISTLDSGNAYVMRGIHQHMNDVYRFVKGNKAYDDDLKEKFFKTFYQDSIFVKEYRKETLVKVTSFIDSIYAPESILNEIRYYNFLAYEKKIECIDGQKIVSNRNNGTLLRFPRPNQKYGVEKTMKAVAEKYQHEHDPDYELNLLRERLANETISEKDKEAAVAKRAAYKNNRNQYSMLLQYAAGFGKTNILCWLALRLKDFNQGTFFNKILIVSDRIDLRDQIDMAMANMKVDKTLVCEATNGKVLLDALKNKTTRIIIVNVQKFGFLKEVLTQHERDIFADQRNVYLIDEVHRSQSGDHNASMLTLFDEISDITSVNKPKKDLIIGLTATPSDENLARFGEYQSCVEGLRWVPFDSYTMDEAIADGFVLDPTSAIVPVSIALGYEDDPDKELPKSSDIYGDKERIEEISDNITDIMLNTTFKKVSGRGKAMLATTSIRVAKIYFDTIKELLALKTQEARYARYKDVKVYMVYSTVQGEVEPHVLCGTASEKDTIAQFKNEMNGLMIVVDKLQTGFDEPRLHTLFLDKEISDIGAIQTISRVNRTHPSKEDCLVVDYSINNISTKNIHAAVKKYSNTVTSNRDTFDLKSIIEEGYLEIRKSTLFSLFDDIDIGLIDDEHRLKDYIDHAMLNDVHKQTFKWDMQLYLDYIRQLGLIRNILELKPKYKDEKFLSFMRLCIEYIRNNLKTERDISEVLDFWFIDRGLIDTNDILDNNKALNEAKKQKKYSQHNDGFDVLSGLVSQLNESEQRKIELIHHYKGLLYQFFEYCNQLDRDINKNEMAVFVKNRNHKSDIECEEALTKFFNKVGRRVKAHAELKDFWNVIQPYMTLVHNDYILYCER